jgi:hypothetical protein
VKLGVSMRRHSAPQGTAALTHMTHATSAAKNGLRIVTPGRLGSSARQ